jgi:hypothetical protein
MLHHRFREQIENLSLPGLAAEVVRPKGFVLCPPFLVEGMNGGCCWVQQQIYQLAFQQAEAVVRPSRFERAMAQVWN